MLLSKPFPVLLLMAAVVAACNKKGPEPEPQPANGVLFAVICNRTYKYTSTLLKKHFSSRIALGEGTDGTASVKTKWFNYDQKLK